MTDMIADWLRRSTFQQLPFWGVPIIRVVIFWVCIGVPLCRESTTYLLEARFFSLCAPEHSRSPHRSSMSSHMNQNLNSRNVAIYGTTLELVEGGYEKFRSFWRFDFFFTAVPRPCSPAEATTVRVSGAL